MKTIEEVMEFINKADRLQFIVNNTDLGWEAKFEIGFGLRIDVGEYCDPDGSYEDDVMAFNEAVQAKASEYRSAFGLDGVIE